MFLSYQVFLLQYPRFQVNYSKFRIYITSNRAWQKLVFSFQTLQEKFLVSVDRDTVDIITCLLYSCTHLFCRSHSLSCLSNSVSPRHICQLVQLKRTCFPRYQLPPSANRKQKNCVQLNCTCKHEGQSKNKH